MTKPDPKLALESLLADVALESLRRRQQGEPRLEDGVSDEELARLEALTAPDESADDGARAAALLGTLSPPAAVLPVKPAARSVSRPFWQRRSFRYGVPLVFAAAAALLVGLMPPWSLDSPVRLAELSPRAAVMEDAAPLIAERLPIAQCANVRVALRTDRASLSDSLSAHAYLVQENRIVRWKLSLTSTHAGGLTTERCMPLPAEVSPGVWDLVILIGYPGRLFIGHQAALRASSGAESGSYGGIQFVRRRIQLVPGSVAPEPS